MGLLRRGAKAGLLAGLASGIIVAVGMFVRFQVFSETIRSVIRNNPNPMYTADQLLTFAEYFAVILPIISGLIIGTILGTVFALVHNKYLKGQTLPVQGLVMGVALLVIDLFQNRSALDISFSYFVFAAGVYVVGDLAYGLLMGSLFQRFGPGTII